MDASKPGSAHEMLKARLNRLMAKPSALAPMQPRAPIMPAPVAAQPTEPEPTPAVAVESELPFPADQEPAHDEMEEVIAEPAAKMPEPSAENRVAPRKRSNLPALILMPGSQTGTPCIVLDMSATGARLKVPEGSGYCHPNNMPSHITLFLKSDWLQVECEIVRRADHEMGVRFCSAMRMVQKPPSRAAARQQAANKNR